MGRGRFSSECTNEKSKVPTVLAAERGLFDEFENGCPLEWIVLHSLDQGSRSEGRGRHEALERSHRRARRSAGRTPSCQNGAVDWSA